jgi:predicted dehydrogenase
LPQEKGLSMPEVRLITLDPGHFHAALVQKEMYPGVARQVHVYAPLGPDLLAHLARVAAFNARPHQPTAWELEVHAGPDFVGRMLAERPGNVVVLSGPNRAKIDYILAAVQAGLHVLADKPWVLTTADLPRLQSVLDTAEAQGLVAYDIMTERFEITSMLQRELVNDAEVFGHILTGSADEPAVYMESVHYLKKLVAGVPLRRPDWFFDITKQGEGLTDVGTHLVDLAAWILFPEQAVDYRQDVQLLQGKRWPTVLTLEDFQQVTGASEFPIRLRDHVRAERLEYYCNNSVLYSLRGVHIKLDVLWGLEAAPGAGDSHLAVFRGSQARVEIHQGQEENYRPELYVIPVGSFRSAAEAALDRKIAQLQVRYPGVGVEKIGDGWRIAIPDRYRVGHEAHFAEVTQQFLRYLQDPKSLPAWEKPNMMAKYYVSTAGTEIRR